MLTEDKSETVLTLELALFLFSRVHDERDDALQHGLSAIELLNAYLLKLKTGHSIALTPETSRLFEQITGEATFH